jgi:hypothetical protein
MCPIPIHKESTSFWHISRLVELFLVARGRIDEANGEWVAWLSIVVWQQIKRHHRLHTFQTRNSKKKTNKTKIVSTPKKQHLCLRVQLTDGHESASSCKQFTCARIAMKKS